MSEVHKEVVNFDILACQLNFATLDVYQFDKMRSSYVQVRFYNDKIKKENTTNYNCEIIMGDERHKFESVGARKGFLKLGIEDPPTGSYKVSCNGAGEAFETGKNDVLDIVNSLDVEVLSAQVSGEEETKTVKLSVNINNVGSKVEDVYCFYRKSKNLKGALMTNAKFVSDKSTIDCGEFSPNGGGVYQFGALLVQSKEGLK